MEPKQRTIRAAGLTLAEAKRNEQLAAIATDVFEGAIFARGDTVSGFDDLPKRYRDALLEQGIPDQKTADALSVHEAQPKIRAVQATVGDGNARRLPLGVGAVSARNYRTEANRSAVGAWLFRYWAGEFEETAINLPLSRGESRTGAALAPKLVTKVDVEAALARLSYARQDLYDLLWRRYARDIKLYEIARSDHRSQKTIGELHREGLNRLVDELWRDLT